MAVWQNPEKKVWEPPKEAQATVDQNQEPLYKPQGWGSVGGDVGRLAMGAIPEALQSIPGLIQGAGNLALEVGQNELQPGKINPRIAAAAAIGFPDFIRKVLNQPGRGVEYLGEKGIVSPEAQQYGKKMQLPETGLMEKFLGKTTEGEQFAHGLAPFILLRNQLAAAPAITTGAIAGIEGENPFAGALLGKAAQKTGEAIGGLKNEYQNRKILNELKAEGNTYGDELKANVNELQAKLPTYEESIKTAQEQAAESAQALQKAEELQAQATANHPAEFENIQNEKFRIQEEGIEAEQQAFAKQQEIAQQELAQQQQALAAQQEQAQKAQEAQQNLENIKYETGHASSFALNNKIRNNQEALKELNQQIEQAPDISHLPQAEKIFAESEKQLAETEKELSSTEDQLNKKLGKDVAHNVRVAKVIYEKQSAIEKGISQEYEDIGEASKDYKIPLNENPERARLEKELKDLAAKGISFDFVELMNKIQNEHGAPVSQKSIPAKEYLQNFRSKRNEGYKLIRQGNEKGGSATVEGQSLRDAGQKLLDEAESMLSTYKKYVPEDVSNRLLATNEEFRTKVAPLKTSTMWRAVKHNKKITGKDLIEKFLGEAPDLEIMRGHILSDPIASELMLGSRLAGKPEKWNDYHEASIPYLQNASPETIELFKQHSQLNEAIPKIKETAKQSQEVIKELTPAKNQVEAAQKKIDSTAKEIEKWKSELETLRKAEAQTKEAKKAIKIKIKDFSKEKGEIALEAKQGKLNRAKEIKSLERKNMTLKQVEAEHKAETARRKEAKKSAEQELSKAEKARDEHLKRLKEEEAKIEASEKERAQKIKEAEAKLKFNKDKFFKLVKAGGKGMTFHAVMKMLIG